MPKQLKTIRIDVTNLDRTTILGQIRYAYRLGYEEIHVYFKNIEAPHLRKDERHQVREIIHHGTIRLLLGVGMEVVDDHNIILKVKENKALQDVAQVMREIVTKMTEMHADILLLAQGHIYVAHSIEEKHDSITRLVSYCTRMLSKTIQTPTVMTHFHIMANIDKVADIIKYMARDYLTANQPMSRTSISLLKNSHTCIDRYKHIYSKGTLAEISAFALQRDEVKRQMRATVKSLDEREAFLLGQETSILEILTDMMESAIALKKA